ncbi:(R,R)-butanediol dehydrogenase, partial [Neolecta irregularis DAH-3]
NIRVYPYITSYYYSGKKNLPNWTILGHLQRQSLVNQNHPVANLNTPTMKAALYYGQHDIRIEDIPEPEPLAHEIKIRVAWNGICGTDLHEYIDGPILTPKHGKAHPITKISLPVVLGHEFSGTIVAVGSNVEGFAIGERVAVDPLIYDNTCPQCRLGRNNICEKRGHLGLSSDRGGLAEYCCVEPHNLHKLPANVSLEMGALVESLAVGWHAVRESGFQKGQTALVLGAGPIGLSVLLALEAIGAKTVIVSEIAELRKTYAQDYGALVLDPTKQDIEAEIKGVTEGLGVDVSYDTSGVQQSLDIAIKAIKPGGTAFMIALWKEPALVDTNELAVKEKRFMGGMAFNNDDYPRVIEAIADSRLKPEKMITARVPLSQLMEKGIQQLIEHKACNVIYDV